MRFTLPSGSNRGCGKTIVTEGYRLRSGRAASCGCSRSAVLQKYAYAPIDMTGRRFGKLEVIELAGRIRRYAAWRCRCDCGKEHVVIGVRLRSGETTSCGCIQREMRRAFGRRCKNDASAPEAAPTPTAD